MITLLPMLAQAPAAAADNAQSDAITVVGSRLRRIRLAVKTNAKGKVTMCEATVSSGDVAFDAQACEATRVCADQTVESDAITDCVNKRLVALVASQRGTRRSKNGNDAQD